MALVEADVIGPFPIVDAKSGKDVHTGADNVVVLDDAATNVPALVGAGLIVGVRPHKSPEAPARSASKPEWVAYATKQGMDAAEAEAATRDDLAARFS